MRIPIRVAADCLTRAFGCLLSVSAVAAPPSFESLGSTLPQFQRHELRRLDILSRLSFFGEEDLQFCTVPPQTAPNDIDLHRSLFVHDRATLDGGGGGLFNLAKTLGQIANQVNAAATVSPAPTALSIFRQLWDTQNAAPGIVPTATSPHCSDNGNTLNGFPSTCRSEGNEAADTTPATMNGYQVIGLVNRLDLAHEGWRNCGEFRIVYAKPVSGIQKNFIIFEAVLPNPKPGCREGCMDVARFWRDLSANASPDDRAQKLEKFYYTGLPGMRPVVHVDHYSAKGVTGGYGSSGSGQIRTNQFLNQPWTLKEFKTVIDCGGSPCRFDLVPIMVKVNPHGDLWNEDVANGASPIAPLAQAFQNGVLSAGTIGSLSNATLMQIGYSVDLTHDAAESVSQSFAGVKDNYRDQFNAATGATAVFRNNLAAMASAHGLTTSQMVNRALTQSCAGCHNVKTFALDAPNSIGPAISPAGTLVTNWPSDAGFVHVDAPIIPNLSDFMGSPVFGSGSGNNISDALRNVFLPARKNFLLAQLNAATCECVNRFRFLDAALANRAIRVQRLVDTRLRDRLESLKREARTLEAGNVSPQARAAMETKIRAFQLERDSVVNAELKRAGVPVPTESLKAQVLKLSAARGARGDAARERALRQQEVLRIAAAEPPRRTVTGSFTVH